MANSVKTGLVGLVYRFGVFEVSVAARELLRQGRPVKIQDQPFELLLLFLERPGEILDRQFFRERLWPGNTFVDFAQSLSTAVTKLRQVLGDDSADPRFIETVPKRGYRFIAAVVIPAEQNPTQLPAPVPAVRVAAEPAAPAVADLPTQRTGTRHPRRLAWAALATVRVFSAAGFVYWRHRHAGFVLAPKDTVVLADFENATGESIFNDALHQALIVEMAQSPVLHLLPDRKASVVFRQMGHSPDERMTGRTALELCRRVGGKVVVQGSISSLGTSYLVGLAGIRCDTGKPIAQEQMEATRSDDVVDALGKTSAKLRARLGESLPSIQKYNAPLELATTPSLDALKMYSQALSTWDEKGDLASLPYFKQTVAIDPGFALAYSALATVYNNLGQADLARDSMVKAFALRTKVTEAERASIEARYYLYVTEEIDKAAETYAGLAREYPDSAGSLAHLATAESKLGQDEQAAEHLRQALRIDPTRAAGYGNLAVALIRLNRFDEASAVLADADKRGLRTGYWLQINYLLGFLKGNAQQMEDSVRASASVPGAKPALMLQQAETEAYHGRLVQALTLARAAAELMQAAGDKEGAASGLAAVALIEAEDGDAHQASSLMFQARSLSNDKSIQTLAALVAAQAGEMQTAVALSDALDKQYPRGTYTQNFWLPVVRARLELRRGHAMQAVHALSTAGSVDPAGAEGFSTTSLLPDYVRGQAYLAAGNGDQAAVEFHKLIDQPGRSLNSPFGSLAYLGLARALVLSSRLAEAQQAYQKFFTLWSGADAEVPLLHQARAEADRLRAKQ
jgi:DNA-binding winged helix-turn-helix (wHTH) protein/tetratricopeptide (TPR) repeat protein